MKAQKKSKLKRKTEREGYSFQESVSSGISLEKRITSSAARDKNKSRPACSIELEKKENANENERNETRSIHDHRPIRCRHWAYANNGHMNEYKACAENDYY